MKPETIAMIKREIGAAQRFNARHADEFEDLKKCQRDGKLSCWGYRDLGALREAIDKNMDIIDILTDILKMEGENI